MVVKTARLVVAIWVFASALLLLVDVGIWLVEPDEMVTPLMQMYFLGSPEVIRAFIAGGVVTGVAVHIVGWGRPKGNRNGK